MQTYQPSLELLRQVFGSHVQDCRVELIKTTLPWSLVYRVTLLTQGRSMPHSVIVKAINAQVSNEAFNAEREVHFYQILHPQLNIPKPVLHGLTTDGATGWFVIVMEDLSITHRIPNHPYQWTRAELGSVLRAYALLHTTDILLSDPWLSPRHESQLDFDLLPEQVATVQHAGIWGELPQLSDLIAFLRESCKKYEQAELTLLHNDTTPTNAPLPLDVEARPATLIDWQDVGIGMPEMDLAYIDLQPFNSARLLPRAELLAHYWHARPDDTFSSAEHKLRQLHADLVMAFWLTRPASHVALHPYPAGSYQRMHWDSQFGIVYNRLNELSNEINK